MSDVKEAMVTVNGNPCRVWRKGSGEPIVYLPGFGGLPRWTPFLDRLAKTRLVIAPSLPGHPGAEAFRDLDNHLDWLDAVNQLITAATADVEGADLMGVSVGGALAADIAALWPAQARRLILLAPFGLFDERDPVADIWAQKPGQHPAVLCADPDKYAWQWERPNDIDEVEWEIIQVRAQEAAARLLWPLGNTGLERRLHRIAQPTLLLWGTQDRIVPRTYAERIADRIAGDSAIAFVDNAGHLAEIDAPDTVAAKIDTFLG
jgi:pimeloyl-ACP methyl ester carboxylesterase